MNAEYPEPQNTCPSTIAAPALHEPPLAKLQSTWPLAACKAYMWPSVSIEHAKTTSFARLTGPWFTLPSGSGVCHRISPVLASMALQNP